MIKAIKRLLSGPLPTVAALEKASTSIDLPALEAALSEAQQRRASILLDGTVEDILAAERKIDEARIALERAQVTLSELDRRRAEAEDKAKRDALVSRHAEVQRLVDEAVARIEEEYPAAARTIAELTELAQAADAAAGEWFHDLQEGLTDDLPAVEPVAKRLGWRDEYFNPPLFENASVLPPVSGFEGLNIRWPTREEMWAIHGAGTPPQRAA
jgi:hypothetical protein